MANGSRSRRGFLTAVAAAAGTAAGCTSIVEEIPGAPSRELVDQFHVEKRWMEPGEWWVDRFVLERSGTLRYEFSADSPADVFLLTESVYLDRYTVAADNHENDGIPFEYIEDGSVLGEKSGQVSVSLDPGRYAVVFDNTKLGPAASDEIAYDDVDELLSSPRWEGRVYIEN